jgi:cell division protein FtsN
LVTAQKEDGSWKEGRVCGVRLAENALWCESDKEYRVSFVFDYENDDAEAPTEAAWLPGHKVKPLESESDAPSSDESSSSSSSSSPSPKPKPKPKAQPEPAPEPVPEPAAHKKRRWANILKFD